MDLFGHGAFGIDIGGSSPTIRWIAISWGASQFLARCTIAVIAYYQIIDHGLINPYLKSLFLISVLNAWSSTMADLIGNIIMLKSGTFPNTCTQLYAQSAGFFFVAMLATLVLRLHMTFQHSIYRMSKTLTYIFITIFALSFVLSVVGAILLVLYPDSPEKMAYGTGIRFFLMFLTVSAIGGNPPMNLSFASLIEFGGNGSALGGTALLSGLVRTSCFSASRSTGGV